jgi:hypothetical protein
MNTNHLIIIITILFLFNFAMGFLAGRFFPEKPMSEKEIRAHLARLNEIRKTNVASHQSSGDVSEPQKVEGPKAKHHHTTAQHRRNMGVAQRGHNLRPDGKVRQHLDGTPVSEDTERAIHRRYTFDERTQKDLVKEFNIGRSTIQTICRGGALTAWDDFGGSR